MSIRNPSSSARFGLMLLILLSLLVGCTQHPQQMLPAFRNLQCGDLASAQEEVLKSKVCKSAKNRFLCQAEQGLLLHLAGDYQASSRAFDQAVRIADELEPMSVTGTLANYTITEVTSAYPGEDFERAYLHYYMALNYIMLEDYREALVEFRRLDDTFRKLYARHEGDDRYQEDGYIRFLSGLVYDAMRERNDALVDYRSAWDWYASNTRMGLSLPEELAECLCCCARALGMESAVPDEVLHRCESCNDEPGQIVVVIENGWAPYKKEQDVRVALIPELLPEELRTPGNLGALIKIAYPELKSCPRQYDYFRLRAAPSGIRGQTVGGSAERVQSMDRLARWALQKRINGIKFRSTARATIKQIAVIKTAQAEKKSNASDDDSSWIDLLRGVAGDVTRVLVAETEVADTRSWLLLPHDIWLARLTVDPGTYDVHLGPGVDVLNPENLSSIQVAAGQTVIRTCRVLGYDHPLLAEEE